MRLGFFDPLAACSRRNPLACMTTWRSGFERRATPGMQAGQERTFAHVDFLPSTKIHDPIDLDNGSIPEITLILKMTHERMGGWPDEECLEAEACIGKLFMNSDGKSGS
jgi:hypothetical protein